MPYFYKAQDTGRDFYFEVCDDSPNACSHTENKSSHRIYNWGKSDADMPVASMVAEVKALEASRAAGLVTPPANPLRLARRGALLEGQEL